MKENLDQLIEFLEEDEGTFLSQMIEDLSDEELTEFMLNNPDFMIK